MIDNFVLSQSIILFMIAVDRYCALFPNYSPFVKSKFIFFGISLIPHVISMVLLDDTIDLMFIKAIQYSALK